DGEARRRRSGRGGPGEVQPAPSRASQRHSQGRASWSGPRDRDLNLGHIRFVVAADRRGDSQEDLPRRPGRTVSVGLDPAQQGCVSLGDPAESAVMNDARRGDSRQLVALERPLRGNRLLEIQAGFHVDILIAIVGVMKKHDSGALVVARTEKYVQLSYQRA